MKPPPQPESLPGDDGVTVGACEGWRRVTLVLELVEHRCHLLPGAHQLTPVLFNLLNRYINSGALFITTMYIDKAIIKFSSLCGLCRRILELEENVRLELEYTQQLVLSCLLAITTHYTAQDTDTRGTYNIQVTGHTRWSQVIRTLP